MKPYTTELSHTYYMYSCMNNNENQIKNMRVYCECKTTYKLCILQKGENNFQHTIHKNKFKKWVENKKTFELRLHNFICMRKINIFTYLHICIHMWG